MVIKNYFIFYRKKLKTEMRNCFFVNSWMHRKPRYGMKEKPIKPFCKGKSSSCNFATVANCPTSARKPKEWKHVLCDIPSWNVNSESCNFETRRLLEINSSFVNCFANPLFAQFSPFRASSTSYYDEQEAPIKIFADESQRRPSNASQITHFSDDILKK